MRISLIGLLGVASASKRETVSTGRSFSFIIHNDKKIGEEDGVVRVAGKNSWGQLGTGNFEDKNDLYDITVSLRAAVGEERENATVKAIAAGAFHSLLLLDTGEVFSVGRDHHGQLGVGMADGLNWNKVDLPKVQAVAAGYAHSVFLLEDGTVMATGSNSAGQLGLGDKAERRKPEQMLVVNTSTAIAAGYDFTYILQDGGVYSTGQNLGGQLGVGDKMARTEPTMVKYEVGGNGRRRANMTKDKVTQISAGNSHGLFVDTSERLWSVGTAFNGQLGNGACNHKRANHGQGNLFHTMPVHDQRTTHHKNVKLVSAAGDSSCVSTWQLNCFGSNLDGQLGLGSEATNPEKCMADNVFPRPKPVSDELLDFVDSMSLSDSHSLFLNHGEDADNVYATGSNVFGELGNSSWEQTYRPKYLVEHTEDREQRTTTAAPPTPSPTPPPTPSPTPETTRAGQGDGGDGDDDGVPWPLIIMGGGVATAVVVLLVVLARGGNDDAQAQADGGPADGPQEDLEMIRGQMSMN